MTKQGERVGLITGANVGLGKEIARQLAETGHYRKLYLACRNRAKAEAAQAELEAATHKQIFAIVQVDVTDLASVRAAVESLDTAVDDLIMNAGGFGGPNPLALTRDGVTNIFAINLLGHVVLLDTLLTANKLTRSAVYLGSEAARGVPGTPTPRPVFRTSSADEFASVIDGRFFQDRPPDATLAYGQVKYLAALWMAAMARKRGDLRFVTMSPGNTGGTEVMRDLSLFQRVLFNAFTWLTGRIHPIEVGARRIVDAVQNDTYRSGVFYASEAKKLTGPVVDQSTIFGDLAIKQYQDNANAAIHRFIGDTPNL